MRGCTKSGLDAVFFRVTAGFAVVTNSPADSGMVAAAMAGGARNTFEPAGAGALLATATGVGVGVGALVGWSAGNLGYGAVGGAVAGVPAGVLAVYLRYRGSV